MKGALASRGHTLCFLILKEFARDESLCDEPGTSPVLPSSMRFWISETAAGVAPQIEKDFGIRVQLRFPNRGIRL
ncbi:hypothetical protein LEP1GSC060_0252 [Leptospira weilii serovar Ranarum str. ICFT]|uniref:Uncharacterized protein n=1 Tax=Leptospira weilii serovar Ranarum str. ICFT TaxID=1218598 RepID=N1WGF9_9LEPT|nr:hypothetical protein LEP1GSC060_0252 [Leptospira weilii serovar Ranarum str. ICFT]